LVDPVSGVGSCSLDVDACATHGCPRGFVCQNDQCLNACGSIVACPDGLCVDGACIPVRGDAGVLPLDAGRPTPHITSIVGANQHFCAIGTDPSSGASGLWCWGQSATQELGDRLVAHGACAACSPVPVRVLDASGAPMMGVTAVAGANADSVVGSTAGYTCAVIGGGVQCWGTIGNNAYGPSPQPIHDAITSMPLTDVRSIDAAMVHACVRVGAAGDVSCWGTGSDGQLGTGMTTDAADAVRATQIPSTATSLALAWLHTLALMPDGSMLSVGNNDGLGFGTTATSPVTTASMSTEAAASFVATGRGVTCIVARSDQSVQCFGWVSPLVAQNAMDTNCPLGACTLAPTVIPAPTGETIAGLTIGAGNPASTVCIWTASGRAYCAGSTALALSATAFAAVPNLSNVAEIAAGNEAMCARTMSGEVWCWGIGENGELGRGTMGSPFGDPVPQRVLWP
jgi:hypothetical protein